MDARQERGLQIAAVSKVMQKGKVWLVPSQSNNGTKYTVSPDKEQPHCSCPDHEAGFKCKHIFAVEYVIQREFNFDGSITETETVTVQETVKRTTYPQKWSAYNAAQTHEKERFLELLNDLCDGVSEPEQAKTGRPRLPLRDAIFAACYKVYSTVSCRRFMTDLREAQEKGYIRKTPHFNSIFNYLENPALTPILKEMIVESSLPLKAVEQDFACDSSGFTTSRFVKWFDHKYGVVRQRHAWVKVHLMCGVKTNIVTAVEIHDRDASDTKQLPDLVNTTAQNFKLNEVSGDKGYGSLNNYAVIASHGATPYIAFKSIHSGKGGGLWAKMYHFYQFKRDEFLSHYHKRSNVETTFSMIKSKFRDHVRSKTDVAMVNEVLCKILCHNLCVLIQESFELGVSGTFWAENTPAQKLGVVG